MITKRVFSSSLILSAALTISACGGSGTLDLEAAATDLSTKISSYMSELSSSVGLNSKALANLFDDKFLDSGFTKADLVSSLAANTTALSTTSDLSLFPMANITNSKVFGCDNNGICSMSATLTNSDADTTSIDFSTKVIVISGVVYFYGDQSSTTSI